MKDTKPAKNQYFTKKKQYGWDTLYHKTASVRMKKNGRNQKSKPTNKYRNTQIIPRRNTKFRKIYTKLIRKNRQHAAVT